MSKYKLLFLSFVVGFILIFFQQTIFSNFLSLKVVPNLMLILCIYLTLIVPNSIVNFLVFALGLFVDSNIGLLLGPTSFSLLILYIVLTKLSQRIVLSSFISVIIVSFCASIFFSLIYLSILSQFVPTFDHSYFQVFLEAIVTGFLSPILFLILSIVIGKQKISD